MSQPVSNMQGATACSANQLGLAEAVHSPQKRPRKRRAPGVGMAEPVLGVEGGAVQPQPSQEIKIVCWRSVVGKHPMVRLIRPSSAVGSGPE